jgi:hypothetical protein
MSPSTTCTSENSVVRVDKIGEKSQRFYNHKLLARFILFEHKVHGTSNFLSSNQSSCIEIVAYASYVDHEGTNNDSKVEASRLYLCSKKIFNLASSLEDQKGHKNRKGSRPMGSNYAQILMLDYMIPRIVMTRKVNTKNIESLQVFVYIYLYIYIYVYVYIYICARIYEFK